MTVPKYSVIIQWSEEDEGFVAWSPEVPGVSGHGDNRDMAVNEWDFAVQGHLEWMREDGLDLPEPKLLGQPDKPAKEPKTVRVNVIVHEFTEAGHTKALAEFAVEPSTLANVGERICVDRHEDTHEYEVIKKTWDYTDYLSPTAYLLTKRVM